MNQCCKCGKCLAYDKRNEVPTVSDEIVCVACQKELKMGWFALFDDAIIDNVN